MQRLKTLLLVIIIVLLLLAMSARQLLNCGDTQFCKITHERLTFTYMID